MPLHATVLLILALLAPSVAFVQELRTAKLIRLHGSNREEVTPLEEAKHPSNNKAAFSVYRCDNFAECRETVIEDTMEIKYRAAASDQVMLVWKEAPRRVLLLTKPIEQAPELLELAAKCAAQLAHQHGIKVFVEPDLHRHLTSLVTSSSEASDSIRDPMTLPPMDALEEWHSGQSLAIHISSDATATDDAKIPTAPSVDLVVTLGGDGLLIHANSLFPRAAPPILAVSGGSLGFLAPFDMSEMAQALESGLSVGDREKQQDKKEMEQSQQHQQQPAYSTSEGVPLSNGLRMSLRMRLSCVFQPPLPTPPPSIEANPQTDKTPDKSAGGTTASSSSPEHLTASEAADQAWEAAWVQKLEDESGQGLAEATEEWTVLNEVVVERGASPYLARLEVYVGGVYLTTMQADGVIFSTPTGSTAYSLSAGGSMVHPAVPAILLTPICPHSLSCRPMILPDSAVILCRNSDQARSDAWVSFDGKHRRRLQRGQSMQITMASHPLPTVNRVDDTSDWFDGIASAFHFNERPMQRPLTPPNSA